MSDNRILTVDASYTDSNNNQVTFEGLECAFGDQVAQDIVLEFIPASMNQGTPILRPKNPPKH